MSESENIVAAARASRSSLLAGLLVKRPRRLRAERALRKSEAVLRSNDRGSHFRGSPDCSPRIGTPPHRTASCTTTWARSLRCCPSRSEAWRSYSVMPAALAEALPVCPSGRGHLSDVHCLSYGLHPAKLELLGLSQAIAGLCHDVSSRYRVQIEFRQREGARVPQPTQRSVCFALRRRRCRTSSNTAARGGDRASEPTRQNIRLHIADDGKGFAGSSNMAGVSAY